MKKFFYLLLLCMIGCQGPIVLANTQVPAKLVSTTTLTFHNCLSSNDTNAQQSFQDLDSCFGNNFGVWSVSGSNIYNNNAGNVGINIASPGAQLDVNGATRTQSLIIPGNNVANNYVWTATGTSGSGHWSAPTGGIAPFSTSSNLSLENANYGTPGTHLINGNLARTTKANIFQKNQTAPAFITNGGTGLQFVKGNGTLDSNTYLTGNQNITFTASGDVNGTANGTTALSPTLTLSSFPKSMVVSNSGKIDNSNFFHPTQHLLPGNLARLNRANTFSRTQTAPAFVTSAGTGSQFVKGNGTLDSTNYVSSVTGDSFFINNASSGGAVTLTKATHTQNSVVGAATSTTVTDLSVPSCSGANNAVQWVTNTGWQCGTISGGGAVSSVSNIDGSLTISPTTGAVVASLTPFDKAMNAGPLGMIDNANMFHPTSHLLPGNLARTNRLNVFTKSQTVNGNVTATTFIGALQGNATTSSSTTGNAATVSTINGLITQGTNVTITGSGTSGSPYNIAATGGGGTDTFARVLKINDIGNTNYNTPGSQALPHNIPRTTKSNIFTQNNLFNANVGIGNYGTGALIVTNGNVGFNTTMPSDYLNIVSTVSGGLTIGSIAGGIGGIDAYTKTMLHFDGTNGSTTITDNELTPKIWTANGSAQLSTLNPKFGTASLLLNGTTDYVSTPTIDTIGSGDWTFDTWVKPAVSGTQVGLLGIFSSANNTTIIYKTTAEKWIFFSELGGVVQLQYNETNAWSYATNTWYHLEWDRHGTNVYFYINGISQALTAVTPVSTNSIYSGSPLQIGTDSEGDYWNGNLDETRMSIGISRNPTGANFTPPNAPYSNTMIATPTITFNLPATATQTGFIETDGNDLNKLKIGQGAGTAITIPSSENVGIGSTNPGYSLDINGSARVTGTNNVIYGTDNSVFEGASAATSGNWQVNTNTLPRMTILNNGNTGIGTVLPSSGLSIGTNGESIGATYNNGTSAPSNGLIVQGNVGIGTTIPTAGLYVAGTTTTQALTIPGNGVANGLCWVATGTTGAGSWSSCSAGGGITNIATTLPITGGPITTTGTIGLSNYGQAMLATDIGMIENANSYHPGQHLMPGNVARLNIINHFTKTQTLNTTGNAGTVSTINGLITNGSNITISGSGTQLSPYSIASTGGGSSQWTTVNTNDVYLPSSGNVGLGTTLTTGNALTIMNGNVGIGTWTNSSSTGTLTVNSNVGDIETLSGTFSGTNGLQVYNNSSGSTASAAVLLSNNQGTLGQLSINSSGFGSNGSSTGVPGNLVLSSVSTNLALQSGGGFIDFVNGTNTDSMTMNGANIGIGTTYPNRPLDVRGNMDSTGEIVSTGLGTASDSTDGMHISYGSGVGYLYGGSSDVLQFGNGPLTGGSLPTTINMQISANGNVGIGSTNPGRLLDVHGNGRTVGEFVATGLGPASDATDGNHMSYNSTTGTAYNYGGASDIMAFGSGPLTAGGIPTTIAVTIQANGNVGIGTTLSTNKLDLNGTLAVGATNAGYIVAPSNGALIQGNVGLGTTLPLSQLSVGSNGLSVGSAYTNTISAPSNGLIAQGNVGLGTSTTQQELTVMGGNVGIGTWASGTLFEVGTGNAPNLFATAAGNVSIGTKTATSQLFTVGSTGQFTVNSSGNLSTSGTITTTGGSSITSAGGVAAGGAISGATTIAASGATTYSGTGNVITMSGTNPTILSTNTTASDGLTIQGSAAASGFLKINSTSVTGNLDFIQNKFGNVGVGTATVLMESGTVGIGTYASNYGLAGGGPYTLGANGNLVVQGNVGIGTWTPNQGLLQVGTVSSNGTIVCFGANNCLGTCSSGASCTSTCTCTCTCKTS